MDLLDVLIDPNHNLLPHDGIVNYHGPIIAAATADTHLQSLLEETPWRPDKVIIHGRHIVTRRQIAWYGDRPFRYHYSATSRIARPWSPHLLVLKHTVEARCGTPFNACLLNLYPRGEVGIAWHSDDETELQRDGTIASLSFGAERKFRFRHKRDKTTRAVVLQHGSLLVMKGATQRHWQHHLPPSQNIDTPRINLTFRNFVGKC